MSDQRFALRVLLKALLLFAAANVAYALLKPLPWLARASAYNVIFPGR